MEHLQSSHEKNKHVTTITFQTKLCPLDPCLVVTSEMHAAAAAAISSITALSHKSFKNCFQVKLSVESSRNGSRPRSISVKIFKNLALHITGAHSLEMIDNIVNHITKWLERFLRSVETPLYELENARKINMVLYKYELPGALNVSKMQTVLTAAGTLAMYDPASYAGIRAKIPLPDSVKTTSKSVENQASVMIFGSGKAVIIIPGQEDHDSALDFVCKRLDDLITMNWHIVKSTSQWPPPSKKRDRYEDLPVVEAVPLD